MENTEANKPYPRMLRFIREHHVLTLATSTENTPWCSSMFYVFLEPNNMFVFTSEDKTKHVNDIKQNSRVAGAIALETFMTGRIRGIQFTGSMIKLEGDLLERARKAYLKRFPIARMAVLHLWGIDVDMMKMTDNRLGFGKKLIWNV